MFLHVWKHYEFAQKLNSELAELKLEIFLLDSETKVHLGIKLFQAG